MSKAKQRLNNYAKEIVNNYYKYNFKTKEFYFETDDVDIDDMVKLAGYMHQARGQEFDDLFEILQLDYDNLSNSFTNLLILNDKELCTFVTDLKMATLAHYSYELKKLLENKFIELIEEKNESFNPANWDEEGILI